jgi:glutaredoxin
MTTSTTMELSGPLIFYWQPGCTSCLRTREYLEQHGIAYESVNVLSDPGAREALARLGARTVPLLVRGGRWVSAQDPAEVARFVGLAWAGLRLAADELLDRIAALLDVAAGYAERWPEHRLAETLPGRDRSHADLLFHVAMIVEGLLDAADPQRGGALTYAHFERRPAVEDVEPGRLARRLRDTRAALAQLRLRGLPAGPAAAVNTYYGERPVHEVIERTAWHVAQHLRQIDHLAREVVHLSDVPALEAELLAGLPLPKRVWDAEIQFRGAGALD